MTKAKSSRVVVVDAPLPPKQRAGLEALSGDLRLLNGLTAANLRQADVVYLGDGQIDPAAVPNLRWVQFNSAGIGALLGTPLAGSTIPVATASGAYSTTVAEMALALLFALLRKLPVCFANQQARIASAARRAASCGPWACGSWPASAIPSSARRIDFACPKPAIRPGAFPRLGSDLTMPKPCSDRLIFFSSRFRPQPAPGA